MDMKWHTKTIRLWTTSTATGLFNIMCVQDVNRMELTFKAVKPVFAEYNKWDEYGIVLLFKGTDMAPNERLIGTNGTAIPRVHPLKEPCRRGCFDCGKVNYCHSTSICSDRRQRRYMIA